MAKNHNIYTQKNKLQYYRIKYYEQWYTTRLMVTIGSLTSRPPSSSNHTPIMLENLSSDNLFHTFGGMRLTRLASSLRWCFWHPCASERTRLLTAGTIFEGCTVLLAPLYTCFFVLKYWHLEETEDHHFILPDKTIDTIYNLG